MRAAIEDCLIAGATYRQIRDKFKLSLGSISRHAHHMVDAMERRAFTFARSKVDGQNPFQPAKELELLYDFILERLEDAATAGNHKLTLAYLEKAIRTVKAMRPFISAMKKQIQEEEADNAEMREFFEAETDEEKKKLIRKFLETDGQAPADKKMSVN